MDAETASDEEWGLMDQQQVSAAPVVTVAQHLTEIVKLSEALETQAVHKANDRLMPGGLAMVALGNVANIEAWSNRFDTAERLGMPTDFEDDSWYPPLQSLTFWSEQWRAEHGAEYGTRPTIASEANFIRWCLDWAWDNEPHWDDFAKDIRQARARLENILYAGIRVERGVPCMYDECKGARLVRFIDDNGERTDWRCPKCRREWDEDRYAAMVTAANEAAKTEDIGGEVWCSLDYAARDVGRSRKTIQTWVNSGHVSTVCIIRGKRIRFVSLDQVRDRDEEASRRNRKAS